MLLSRCTNTNTNTDTALQICKIQIQPKKYGKTRQKYNYGTDVEVGDCAAQQVWKIQIQQDKSEKYKYSKKQVGKDKKNCNLIAFLIRGYQVPENRVSSLLAWAQAEGKATGIVTTDRFKKTM